MLLKMALKNLSHSKGRTITTLLLSGFTTAFFVFYVALTEGAHNEIYKNSIEIYTGYIHVDREGYRDDEGSYDYLMENTAAIKRDVAKAEGVAEVSERFETFALLAATEKAVGAMITGIEPEAERSNSMLSAALHEGAYLEDKDTNAIYMGNELAKRLGAEVGSEVAMIGTASDYSFAAEKFVVKGLFRTGLFEFDASASFVNKAWFDGVMVSDDIASYLVVRPADTQQLDATVSAVDAALPEGYEAVGWPLLLSALVEAMMIDNIFNYLSVSIFLVVIFFVIMIFGYVNINARTKEIGILRALGLTPSQLWLMLFYEVLILGVISVGIGALIGGGLAYYFELNPIIIEGLEEMYKDYGIVAKQLPALFDLALVLLCSFLIFLLNLLALIYPIRKITQLSPVEAMHHV